MKNTMTTLENAVIAANLSPADMLRITAEALAELACTCGELEAGSSPCRACREASYLSKIASKVDMPEAMTAVAEACGNAAVALVDLLPGIVEGILARDPAACTCDGAAPCPICDAARSLDDLHRELQAG